LAQQLRSQATSPLTSTTETINVTTETITTIVKTTDSITTETMRTTGTDTNHVAATDMTTDSRTVGAHAKKEDTNSKKARIREDSFTEIKLEE